MGHDLDFVRRVLGLLDAAGVACWLFGGWAEELRGLCPARAHGDVVCLVLPVDGAGDPSGGFVALHLDVVDLQGLDVADDLVELPQRGEILLALVDILVPHPGGALELAEPAGVLLLDRLLEGANRGLRDRAA